LFCAVADVRPFRAITYRQETAGPLGDLLSPPYDVQSEEERARYLGASPYNAVHLDLPEIPYEEVRALIDRWLSEGVLERSGRPLMIAWTQTFALGDAGERERRTLIGAVALEPYSARVVRPHERTHAGPKEDRLRLTRAVAANLSPVFGLYPDPEGAAWTAAAVSGPPWAELTDPDGVVHRLWKVEDPAALEAVAEALADRWILIADGHHRYETALAYRDERVREAGDDPDAPYQRVMMGLTSLDDPGLVVLPTHRLLTRWPEGAGGAFTRLLVADLPALRAALADAPEDVAALGLVTPEGMWLLTAEPEPGASPAEGLDVAVIERRLLVPDLGADQAALAHDGLLTYTKDDAEAAAMVAAGDVAAALILRPIPKPSVAAVSESGETMPQKSTYFFPKLLTGAAFHTLDDG
jgi:uncharacterized protein (DUF1015 family)